MYRNGLKVALESIDMGMVAMTVDDMSHGSNNTKLVKEAEKKKNRFFNKFIRADQVKIPRQNT